MIQGSCGKYVGINRLKFELLKMLEQRVRSEVLSETMVVLNGNRYETHLDIWLKLLGWCFGNNYATYMFVWCWENMGDAILAKNGVVYPREVQKLSSRNVKISLTLKSHEVRRVNFLFSDQT